MERDARAMALRIIAEEERDGWSRPLTSDADDAFQRRFGALGIDEATERLTEEEALQAKILMRDLPRVLAALTYTVAWAAGCMPSTTRTRTQSPRAQRAPRLARLPA